MNEGLERLEGPSSDDAYSSVFYGTQIRKITFPTTLRALEDSAFYRCRQLKYATFREGSQLERIGRSCFAESGLEEVWIPRVLKPVGAEAFANCSYLKTVHIEDDCAVSLFGAGIPSSARVVRPQNIVVSGRLLLGLRTLKEVVMPEGV